MLRGVTLFFTHERYTGGAVSAWMVENGGVSTVVVGV